MTVGLHLILISVFVVGLSKFSCLAFENNYVKRNEDTFRLSATEMFARDFCFRRLFIRRSDKYPVILEPAVYPAAVLDGLVVNG